MQAYDDLALSFLPWDTADENGKLKWEFSKFGWVIATSLNWKLEEHACLQFNFQHNNFPAHTDGCGLLQPRLLGGDGFGEQIAVLTLKGANELFLANEVPNTNPPRYVGIRICIGKGTL